MQLPAIILYVLMVSLKIHISKFIFFVPGSNTFLTRSPESSKDANMKNLKKASKYLQGKIELEQNTVQIYTSAIDNLHKLDISDEDSLAKMNEIMDEVDQAVANVDDKIREYEERGKTLKDQNDK